MMTTARLKIWLHVRKIGWIWRETTTNTPKPNSDLTNYFVRSTCVFPQLEANYPHSKAIERLYSRC